MKSEISVTSREKSAILGFKCRFFQVLWPSIKRSMPFFGAKIPAVVQDCPLSFGLNRNFFFL